MGISFTRVSFYTKRVLFILGLWSVSIPCLYFLSNPCEECTYQTSPVAGTNKSAQVFGPFSTSRYTNKGSLCEYSLAFDQLKISGSKAGLFRTALWQTANVTNLRLQSILPKTSETPKSEKTAHSAKIKKSQQAADPLSETFSCLFQLMQPYARKAVTVKFSFPDMSRAVRFSITGFNWRLFDQNTFQLDIQSSQAFFDACSPNQLLLKGHVVLKNTDQVIESNYVIFDTSTKHFEIPGPFLSSTNNEKSSGRNSCVDVHLKYLKPAGENICLLDHVH